MFFVIIDFMLLSCFICLFSVIVYPKQGRTRWFELP